jgi:hypothetical protein
MALGGFLGVGTMALGQAQSAVTPEVMGRGCGGTPQAWNENEGGICDITGRPVGQGCSAAFPRSARSVCGAYL